MTTERKSRMALIAAVIAIVGALIAAAVAGWDRSALFYGAGAFIILFVGILIGAGFVQGIAEASRQPPGRKKGE
jgi:hypothetical protein